MTTIIKYGSESIQNVDDLSRVAKQLEERKDERIVVVTGALGNTTEAIAEILYGEKKDVNRVFGNYNELVAQIADSMLTKSFELVRREFTRFVEAKGDNHGIGRNIDDICLSRGEELTARLLQTYLKKSGIASSLVDSTNRKFPLRMKENSRTSEIDTKASKDALDDLIQESDILIIPSYAVQEGMVRSMGRGGGDTATFIYANNLNPSSVWIVAEDALTTAPTDYAKVVPEIDLDEAWEAAFFGARLKTPVSVEWLRLLFENHPKSQVYITGKELGARKTRINQEAKNQTVRFIASRDIETYGIKGDWRGFLNELYKNLAIDWFTFGGMREILGIGVSERGRQFFRSYLQKIRERGDIEIKYENKIAHIGVVGSGMKREKGVANRAYTSLKGVNIARTYDPDVSSPNSSSIGIMVDSTYEKQAIGALHREFFGKSKNGGLVRL